jgi:hypothetical protein
MGSAVEFKQRLEAWRADGTFAGLVLTPHDR